MEMTSARHARQVDVAGCSLYVEEHGTGDPIVLVHPGLTASAAYAGVVLLLAEQFRVIVFDSHGHGRSTNPSGTLADETLADDTAAVITALGIERPVVGGWSDGGQVALELGLRHPGRARALIVGGAYTDFQSAQQQAKMRDFFQIDAAGTVDRDAFTRVFGENLLPMMRQMQLLGDSQVWNIIEQSVTMYPAYGGLSDAMLARIDAPVLMVHGDRDELIALEEAVALFRTLPNAELAVLQRY